MERPEIIESICNSTEEANLRLSLCIRDIQKAKEYINRLEDTLRFYKTMVDIKQESLHDRYVMAALSGLDLKVWCNDRPEVIKHARLIANEAIKQRK